MFLQPDFEIIWALLDDFEMDTLNIIPKQWYTSFPPYFSG